MIGRYKRNAWPLVIRCADGTKMAKIKGQKNNRTPARVAQSGDNRANGGNGGENASWARESWRPFVSCWLSHGSLAAGRLAPYLRSAVSRIVGVALYKRSLGNYICSRSCVYVRNSSPTAITVSTRNHSFPVSFSVFPTSMLLVRVRRKPKYLIYIYIYMCMYICVCVYIQ